MSYKTSSSCIHRRVARRAFLGIHRGDGELPTWIAAAPFASSVVAPVGIGPIRPTHDDGDTSRLLTATRLLVAVAQSIMGRLDGKSVEFFILILWR